MAEASQFDLSKGRLSERPLAAVLHAARRLGATGVVRIDTSQGTSRVFVRGGAPAGAQPAFGARPLAQVLVQHGLVDVDTIDRALPKLEQGRPLPDVLLEMGAIDLAGLAEGASLQHREHLRALSRLSDGTWEFAKEPLPAWTETIRLEADAVLAEALEAPEAEGYLVDVLVSLGPRLLKLTDGADKLLDLLAPSEAERAALLGLTEPACWEDLVEKGVSPARARLLTAALFALGGAEAVDPGEAALEKARRAAREITERAEKLAREKGAEAPAGKSGTPPTSELARRIAEARRRAEAKEQERKAAEQARRDAEERTEARLARLRELREKAKADAERAAREVIEQAESDARELEESARQRAEQARRAAEEEHARAEALAADLAQEEARLAEAEKAAAAAAEALRAEEKRLADLEEEVKRVEAVAEVETSRGRAAEQARERLAGAAEAGEGDSHALAKAAEERRRIAELEEKLEEARRRTAELEQERDRLDKERAGLEVETGQLQARRDAARADVDKARRQRTERAEKLARQLADQEAAQREAQAARDEAERRHSQAARAREEAAAAAAAAPGAAPPGLSEVEPDVIIENAPAATPVPAVLIEPAPEPPGVIMEPAPPPPEQTGAAAVQRPASLTPVPAIVVVEEPTAEEAEGLFRAREEAESRRRQRHRQARELASALAGQPSLPPPAGPGLPEIELTAAQVTAESGTAEAGAAVIELQAAEEVPPETEAAAASPTEPGLARPGPASQPPLEWGAPPPAPSWGAAVAPPASSPTQPDLSVPALEPMSLEESLGSDVGGVADDLKRGEMVGTTPQPFRSPAAARPPVAPPPPPAWMSSPGSEPAAPGERAAPLAPPPSTPPPLARPTPPSLPRQARGSPTPPGIPRPPGPPPVLTPVSLPRQPPADEAAAAGAPPPPPPPSPAPAPAPAPRPIVGLSDVGEEDSWNAAMASTPVGLPDGSFPDLGDDDVSNSDEAKARRQRLLRRAFGNLGTFPTPGGGAEQPRAAEPTGAVPVTPAGPSTQTPVPASTPPPAAWSSPGSSEEEALARKIESKFAALKQDHFALLGVTRTATRDQVKAAYLSLVKTFHPDHLPAGLSHLSSQVKDIFTTIREAYETLSDDARREVYLQQLARPKAPPDKKVEDAAALEKQADVHLRKKEYGKAAELFGKAFALTDNPALLAQQAWAMYLDPTRKADLPVIKQMLDQALKMDQLCDKAAYAIGVLARVEGDLAKAEKHFRLALAGNPRHAEASTELRLIELRRKKG